MPSRTRVVVGVALTVDVVLNTILELSPAVARWSERMNDGGASHLPPVIRQIVGARPYTADADVHAVMWFVAGLLVMMVRRARPRRALALVSLWAYSGLLELVQPLTTRSAQWSDLAANAVGIGAAAGVVMLFERRRERGNGHRSPSSRSTAGRVDAAPVDHRGREPAGT